MNLFLQAEADVYPHHAVCESLYKAVIEALKDPNYAIKKKWQLLNLATEILHKSSIAVKKTYSMEFRSLAQALPIGNDPTNCQYALGIYLSRCTHCRFKYLPLPLMSY